MAAENNIELRNIKSLSGLHFYIPAYQRGYRWTATQASQMLKDFKEFADKKDSSKLKQKEFYCLQPIVVKAKSWYDANNNLVDGYEVIDGQQRLTTLYLLFKALGEATLEDFAFDIFSITYATRQGKSDEFLRNIGHNDEEATTFVDFFYMDMVYKAIKNWLKDNKGNRTRFGQILLSEVLEKDNNGINHDTANNVRIIWYELGDNEKSSSIDVFTRLNIGKIPLTNAELVKALLLRKNNFEPNVSSEEKKLLNKEVELKQLHISEEWNEVEHRLQDNAFWYFIYNSTNPVKYDTRIEYLLDLITGKYEKPKTGNENSDIAKDEDKGDYYTFDKINAAMDCQLNNPNRAENEWNKIKRYYQTIEYWYYDRQLFHLIGFLIEYGYSISNLVESSVKKSKKEFLKDVKEKVRESLTGIDLDALDYSRAKDKFNIQKVLLLFNILTVLSSNRSDIKFPFDKYKDESWDREHIASRTDQPFPNDNRKRVDWLNDMIFYFAGADDESVSKNDRDKYLLHECKIATEAIEQIPVKSEREEKLLSILEDLFKLKDYSKDGISKTEGKQFSDSFNLLYRKVNNYFDENKLPEEMKDKLGNMALLNYSINRSYGNAFFPVKRAYIKDNDSKGVFVPIATKNVFMKYYSRKIDNMMVWTLDDSIDYLNAIKNTLKDYLNS